MTDQQTEPKWTRETWSVGIRGHNACIVYSGPDDPGEAEGVCQVYGIPMHKDVEWVRSDERSHRGLERAHAIAALPELYRALAGLLDACERDDGGSEIAARMDEAREALRDAYPDTEGANDG